MSHRRWADCPMPALASSVSPWKVLSFMLQPEERSRETWIVTMMEHFPMNWNSYDIIYSWSDWLPPKTPWNGSNSGTTTKLMVCEAILLRLLPHQTTPCLCCMRPVLSIGSGKGIWSTQLLLPSPSLVWSFCSFKQFEARVCRDSTSTSWPRPLQKQWHRMIFPVEWFLCKAIFIHSEKTIMTRGSWHCSLVFYVETNTNAIISLFMV